MGGDEQNKKIAMELLNWWAAHPKAQACYANAVGYPGNHAQLHKYVKPELAPYLPTNPDNISIINTGVYLFESSVFEMIGAEGGVRPHIVRLTWNSTLCLGSQLCVRHPHRRVQRYGNPTMWQSTLSPIDQVIAKIAAVIS